MEHLASLYFGSHEAVQRLKIRSIGDSSYSQTSGTGGERRYVDHVLQTLERARNSITGWRSQGALLLELLQLLDDVELHK